MSNQPQGRNLPAKPNNQPQKPPPNMASAFNANPLFMASHHWDRLVMIARDAANSGLLPASIKTPQQALIVALKGVEMGFSPLQAFERINVVDGKAIIDGQGMLVLIMERMPECQITWVESTNERCTVRIKNPKQNDPVTETFTIEDAKRAQLTGKNNWQKYPKMMLRWRALAACARIAVPHVIGGAYIADEMGFETTEEGTLLRQQVNSSVAKDVTPPDSAHGGTESTEETPPATRGTPEVNRADTAEPDAKALIESVYQMAEDKGYSREKIREEVKKLYPDATTLKREQILSVKQLVQDLPSKNIPEEEPTPPTVAEVANPTAGGVPGYEKLPFEK